MHDDSMTQGSSAPNAVEQETLAHQATHSPGHAGGANGTRPPVYFSPVLNAWVVTRYDDIVTVLKDHRRFSSALAYDSSVYLQGLSAEEFDVANCPVPLATLHMAVTDTLDHTRLRQSVHKIFTPQQLAPFTPQIRALAHRLIDGFYPYGHADLVEQFNYPLPMQVILLLIGIPDQDMPQIKQWCDDWNALMFRGEAGDRSRYVSSLSALNTYLQDLIMRRREQPQHDFASALVQAVDRNEGDLSLAEMVYLLSHLIGAAHETTASALNACFYFMLKRPRWWKEIQAGSSVIPSLVEEALRCDRAIRGPMRVTTDAAELGGVALPQGARLYLATTVANQDAAQFDDPQQFNPHRERLDSHLAFGRGIHYCLGAGLARLEMQIALECISQRLPGLRLSSQAEIRYLSGPLLRGFSALPVEWDLA